MDENHEDPWWNLLAGKPAPGASPADQRAAQALRDAVVTRHNATQEEVDVETSLARFQARLDRERPVDRSGNHATTRFNGHSIGFFTRFGNWVWCEVGPRVAIAVGLMLVVGVLARISLNQESEFVTRDYVMGQRNYVKVVDPSAHQINLVTELKQLGIRVETLAGPDVNGALVVQASVPSQSVIKVTEIVKRHGLRDFQGDELDVGFKKR
jgi:hypothetical protein